jgi:hypothetical protein
VGSWGFIGLAYGVAAIALGIYGIMLARRLRDAAAELDVLSQEKGRTQR